MLGLDSIFDQWDANERQQTLTEVSCGLRFIVLRFKTLKLFIQVQVVVEEKNQIIYAAY